MSTAATPAPPVVGEPARQDTDASCEHALCLGRYVAGETRQVREIVNLAGADGSVFVVDRIASTRSDERVVAHLSPDEPAENASIVVEMYLADERRGRCRPLTPEDFALTQTEPAPPSADGGRVLEHSPLLDGEGYCFRVRELTTDRSVPELRWARSPIHDERASPVPVKLRDVIARLEDYEPARALTLEVLAAYNEDPNCSTRKLHRELERLESSTFILNRGLREAVLAAGERHGLSMSEIALRCGRTKHDHAGRVSGETSWLARRIGKLPESGAQTPSPWVQSDVLALIAREGLRVCPCEVEL